MNEYYLVTIGMTYMVSEIMYNMISLYMLHQNRFHNKYFITVLFTNTSTDVHVN